MKCFKSLALHLQVRRDNHTQFVRAMLRASETTDIDGGRELARRVAEWAASDDAAPFELALCLCNGDQVTGIRDELDNEIISLRYTRPYLAEADLELGIKIEEDLMRPPKGQQCHM